MGFDWEKNTVSPERVLKKLKSGMIIFIGSGAGEPQLMIRHLMMSNQRVLEDLELIQLLSFGTAVSHQVENTRNIRLKTFFAGWYAASAISRGQVDFIPSRFMHIPNLIKSGLNQIDAAIVPVTPPNEAGYCSLGPAVDAARVAMEKAFISIGEINPHLPFSMGDTFVHIDEFDMLTVSATPPLTHKRYETDDLLDKIAFNAAALVEDGSCLAFFTGPFFDALSNHLAGKRHLGIHTPFFSDALMALIKSGAVSNRRKETHRGKAVTSYAMGTKELFQWIDHNPLIEFQSIDKVFNPSYIGLNPKFVAIIPVNQIDLHGRIGLNHGHGIISSGSAEFIDFISGSELSQGGRAVFVLPSRDRMGKSNVRPSIADLPHQFIRFESVRFVVTEYGVAYLEGLTVRERAQAIIDISHPDDRQELVNQAKQAHILYPDQIFIAECAGLYPAAIASTQMLKNGMSVRFRAIKPSDEEGMRRLFYRFSDESVYSRYFHAVKAMPHSKMQEYVNVDWRKILSIVGIIEEDGQRRIVAEGRYIQIPGSEAAEVVFVVDEQFQNLGIATTLYGMLVQQAIERGVKKFLADVLFSNTAMMKVFRKGDLPVMAYLEEGIYHIEISLSEADQ